MKDLRKVYFLNKLVWKDDPNIHSYAEMKERLSNRFVAFGAFEKEKLIGVIFADFGFKGDKIRATHFITHPEYQGKGVTRAIHENLVDYSSKKSKKGIFVFVLPSNKRMVKVVKSLGYTKVGMSKYLYRGGRTAHIYYNKI